jgi:Fur family transcriptional regulator, peroxide stress response regulator
MIVGMSTVKFHRETRQRETILLILHGTREHPTADRIYEEARKRIPDISKGTVYRNLTVLAERGEITRLDLSGTTARYEIRQKRHYHFQCEKCRRVIDIESLVIPGLNQKLEKVTGYKVSGHQLEFRGLCLSCQPKPG